MAFELTRIDKRLRTWNLTDSLPSQGVVTGVQIALLPSRTGPTLATLWTATTFVSPSASIVLAGPDADSSGAFVVTGSGQLWGKVANAPYTQAFAIEHITLIGGGGAVAPGPLPQVLSVQGRTGAVVLSASDVSADAAGAATTAQAAAIAAIPSMGTIAAAAELRAAFGTVRKLLGSRFAFFGDSITAYGEGFPVYASIISGQRINWSAARTFSHTGYTSGQLAAITSEVTSLSPLPHAVHVHAGANDAQGSVPLATYQTNMTQIIGAIRTAGIAVIVGGVLPLGSATAQPYVRQYNDWLRLYCAQQGLPFIDYYPKLVNRADGTPLATMIGGDGVHPTALGQKTMGQLLSDTLNLVLPASVAPLIAVDNTDPTNLVLHPLALVDTDSNGVADDWYTSGSTTGWTFSLVDDGQATGKWVRMVGSGATGQGTITPAAITSGFSPGDVLAVTCRVRVSGVVDSTSQVFVQLQAFDGSFTFINSIGKLIYGNTQTCTGIASIEYTVPASAARLILYFQGGPGNGTYEIADPSIINLTAQGITP